MNEIATLPETLVSSKIYHVRQQSIMLDFDLAQLYSVETRALKQAVKRNLQRFPEDFMFQLTKAEWAELITNCDNLPSTIKYSPRPPGAFTEAGVAMLSSVLSSERAIRVNIQIIRVFTKLRTLVAGQAEVKLEIEKIKSVLNTQSKDMRLIFQYLDELSNKLVHAPAEPRHRIGYKPDAI